MSQPLIRLGTLRHAGLRSKAESKVASSHEIMLDLFTLISFIMTVASQKLEGLTNSSRFPNEYHG